MFDEDLMDHCDEQPDPFDNFVRTIKFTLDEIIVTVDGQEYYVTANFEIDLSWDFVKSPKAMKIDDQLYATIDDCRPEIVDAGDMDGEDVTFTQNQKQQAVDELSTFPANCMDWLAGEIESYL